MKKKLVFLLVFVMVFSVVVVGCTNEEPQDEAKILKVGTDDAYPPFEFHDEKTNDLIGFDIDFGYALAERLGMEIEWIPTAWDGIFNGVNTGQYDAIISCTSLTPDRMESFAMSKPYLANGIVIVSPTDTEPASTIEQLSGKKVGVQIETTSDIAAQKFIADGAKLNLYKYDTIMDAFAALKGGSIDYILVDNSVGGYYIQTDVESFAITSEVLSNEPIGVTMAKGNTELQEKVNTAIKEMQEDGTMTALSMKWFLDDLATNIDEDLQVIE
ncbi:MAG: ABC transporter substrate-binding protein [Peptostreptococcales bacterium]